ncbi:MAG TPA: phosphatidylserine/phosphatidylglycerophosphate/cardiolipin synthase family protein [Thermoleophilaceae bacterium]|jgi:phosphatidylserine/phosphatidylglycerophosphate/cardiolipin synthase-like enzyme
MDPLLSARLAVHVQLIQCRNGARMTTGGLEPERGAPLVPNDPLAVAALQQALVDQGFSLGTTGPEGNGVDGGYGKRTAEAVLAFKAREKLAAPGDDDFDGVTSVGTTTRLDEIYRHELVDALVASLAGTRFDPIGRGGELQPTAVEGLFECPAAAGGRLVDAVTAATYVPPALDVVWEAQGGPAGELGPPVGLPFELESGRAALDFQGGRAIDDPDAGPIVVPRWAVDVASGTFDLGEPVAGVEQDPLGSGGLRVPHQRGAAFADPGGTGFAFPDELLAAWSEAVEGGTEVGLPTGPPEIDFAAGTIAFPFEGTTLSIGAGAAGPLLGDVTAAGVGDHLRFIVPFVTPTPRPDQIRPPRILNGAEHHVNGDAAFPPMIADVRAAAAAGSSGFVYMANWWVRHDFSIPLAGGATTLGAELVAAAGAGVEVRGLVWDGAASGVPITNHFNKPSVNALNAAGADVLLDGQVQFAGSHHQKLLICFDGANVTAWVGGIDWNEDRIRTVYQDKPGTKAVPHPGYPMVDDMVRVRGGGAHELLTGWLERWERRTGKLGLRGRTLPPALPPAVGTVITQLSHTYGPGCPFPMAVSTAATTIEHVIRRAREYLYIEDQYLFLNARMEAALMDRLRAGVTVIAVITDNELCEVPFGKQARFDAIARVAGAGVSSGIGGLNVFEPLGPGGDPVGPRAYTHCKVVIADDQAAVIGSVNSSNRSWTHDTEVATLFVDAIGAGGTAPGTRGFARQARCDLWREHGALGAIGGDHTADVPAFLSGAVAGGRLRGYDMLTRPPRSLLDRAFEPLFFTICDPS